MTSVSQSQSRVSRVTQSSVSGGREWDHRLDNLLDDLQETVVPPESRGNTSSYREYRVTTSSQRNNEPVSRTDEKWVEYGTGHPGGPRFGSSTSSSGHLHNIDSGFQAINDSTYSGSRNTTTTEKTVNFSDDHFSKSCTGGGSDFTSSLDKNQSRHVEYLTPSNATTVLKSGPSSPINNVLCSSMPPKVERKEYFAKASYSTVIKGGGGPGEVSQVIDTRDSQSDRLLQDIIPRNALPESSYSPPHQPGVSSSISETRRTFTSESTRGTSSGGGVPDLPPPVIGQPLTSSSSYSREVNSNLNQSVTSSPRPAEALKTPPLVRKILQQASSSSKYSSKPPEESPRRLEELMATFEDSSYTSTRHISGDGGGPHESHPYGPGTHHVEQPMTKTRTVRIDESATTRRIIDDETDLHQRKSTSYQNPAYGGKDSGPSRNVSGPPVFYPSNQIFPKSEEDNKALSPDTSKKPKKEPKKSKAKQGDDKGSGAVPVPVCLPVCCAAPCSIM